VVNCCFIIAYHVYTFLFFKEKTKLKNLEVSGGTSSINLILKVYDFKFGEQYFMLRTQLVFSVSCQNCHVVRAWEGVEDQ
jgi:hypothetical protein